MSNIFFYPPIIFLNSIKLNKPLSIARLCSQLKIPCKASGDWIERKVEIKYGQQLIIESEPGDWGAVRITMKKSTVVKEAQTALLVLAYALHDLVAKESIKNLTWSRIPVPMGRIKTGKALSNSERQQRFRNRQIA